MGKTVKDQAKGGGKDSGAKGSGRSRKSSGAKGSGSLRKGSVVTVQEELREVNVDVATACRQSKMKAQRTTAKDSASKRIAKGLKGGAPRRGLCSAIQSPVEVGEGGHRGHQTTQQAASCGCSCTLRDLARAVHSDL